jgi:hypothetical protein
MLSSKSRTAAVAVVMLSSLISIALPAAADNPANVVPPTDVVGGLTYAQWSAAWWAWEMQTPTSPTNDQNIEPNAGTAANPQPVNCALRQTGDVWFLQGTSFFEGQNYSTAYRSCTIPSGKYLFLSPVSATQDDLECPGTPPGTQTADQLRADVAALIDQVVPASLQVTVDGASVQGLTDSPTAFRVQTGYSYTLPSDNALGFDFCGEFFPAGTMPPAPGAFADGIYVMLPPLSVGKHTLEFSSAASGGGASDDHYTVTVATKPGVPGSVAARPGATTSSTSGPIVVSYAAAANNGSPVTSYVARCVSSNGGRTVTGVHAGSAVTPFAVVGATLKRTYSCTVAATNAYGTSAPSTPSVPIVVGAPARVATPTVTRIASGRLRVSFPNLTAAQANGSPLTTPKYTATCRSTNGGVARAASGVASPITVGALTPGKTYSCVVAAHNARGYGRPSPGSASRVA